MCAQDFTDDCFGTTHVVQTDQENVEKNFACLKSAFSGAAAPSNLVAGMWWFDTTTNILKLRNEANNAWQSVWDFANNKPFVTNNVSADFGAVLKDPVAGTPGLRSLGTTSQKACAGNDSRLSNARAPTTHSHGLDTIEHGTVMLPFYNLDSGTPYSETGSNYVIKVSNFRVYIPTSATFIKMAARIKVSGISLTAYVRFTIGGLLSNAAVTSSTSYMWEVGTLDVSGLDGWYDIAISMKLLTGGTAYLQGFSFVWE